MLRKPVCKLLPGLSYQKTRKIFHISQRCVIAAVITLCNLPTTALGGYSATRSFATVAVFSHATRPSWPPMSSLRTDPPDARPDPSGEDGVVD